MNKKQNLSNGIEKMMLYAKPRHIDVMEDTLGIYNVEKNGKKMVHEAVRAINAGIKGWIINMGNDHRQRKFYSETEVNVWPYKGHLKDIKKIVRS